MTAISEWRTRPRKPDPRRLGALVRETRVQLGLTQHQLALRMGVQGSFISKIETGRVKQPGLQFLNPLATALGVSVATLYEAATGEPPADAAPSEEPPADPPADVVSFTGWLAELPETDRWRVYRLCQLTFGGTLPPAASLAPVLTRQ